ncbi:Nucleosome chromatin assembly complex isoform B [Chlorella sorokiniana]|uniref:Nucleosome chromatin assembly complex isoform B n=1 Tax=Chlorella sorokiniana TaxID=3076 RepID=A0A2P6TV39_CHLSO|nr:Nucleosome chromatin assembly complex isoform B [Chlorella sorokiniana]|eukprot:PRW57921.1 Nucleosome chromatin assembly complex isoform B [Chlorella sorokiniana]
MAPKRGEQPDEEFNVPPEVLQQLMAGGGNAGLVQALQRGLANMLGQSSGFIESLPVPVQTRISYLKELDGERAELYERYREERRALEEREERRALEERYDALYAPIYAKRSDVINGRQEAPENETDEGKAAAAAEAGEVPAGIPDFWMVAIRNALEEEAVTEKDAQVLSYCTDVRCERFHDEDGDEGFKLIFAFKENPFFSDAELWKSYYMGDDDDLMLKKVETSGVSWKSGKDVTVKVLKKKPKPGAKSSGKPQTKTEPVESFFRWFTEVPEVPDEEEEAELSQEELEALQEDMQADFEVAEMIKEKVIPEATAWFTGEALMEFEGDDDEEEDEDEDEEEGDEDEEEEEEEEEEESEDEGDAKPKRMPAAAQDAKEQPQECKQQPGLRRPTPAGNNLVSSKELEDWLNAQGLVVVYQTEFDILFQSYDKDKDDHLNVTEFGQMMNDMVTPLPPSKFEHVWTIISGVSFCVLLVLGCCAKCCEGCNPPSFSWRSSSRPSPVYRFDMPVPAAAATAEAPVPAAAATAEAPVPAHTAVVCLPGSGSSDLEKGEAAAATELARV